MQSNSFADVLQSRCSQKFRKFHRKTPMLESLLINVAGLPQMFFEIGVLKNFAISLENTYVGVSS